MHNIFLIGLSGSGKSTVGHLLAERLGKPLIDIDAFIVKECGESIATIFTQHGEEYFRSCESRILAQVAQTMDAAVIATGGGIVTRPENRSIMRERGVCVYLSVDPAVALERLSAQRSQESSDGETPEVRPLLAGPDPLTALQKILDARSSWYEDAHFTCSTQGKSAEQVTREIIAILISSGEIVNDPPLASHKRDVAFRPPQGGVPERERTYKNAETWRSELPVPPTVFVRRVLVGEGYNVVVDWGGLGRLGQNLKMLNLPPRVFLITDTNVCALYGSMLVGTLSYFGFDPQLYTVPAGEASKSQNQLSAIYDWLIDQHAERGEAIIALGGGLIGDLAGYAAATYLRGVPLVQVPTSLLAQVDAAIGGKTGINHARGKNLIGAFYHPRLVLVDPATLLTLPARERTEGWAEVVKYGIILDAKLFAQLEAHADSLRDFSHPQAALLCQIVARCIALKASVIEEDEREQARRAILNYGHTIAHALENVSGYGALLHGEAVSLGMVVAATIAQGAGMLAETALSRQNKLLEALGLPVAYNGPARAQDILAAIQLDKKVVNKEVQWVMPQGIGEVVVTPMPGDLVRSVITAFFAEKRP